MPHHVFLLAGQRIQSSLNADIDPYVFAKARKLAERSMVDKGNHKGDLYDIYEELALNFQISKELAHQMASIELEVEFEQIIPVKKNIELLNNLRNNGDKVIYVSDMYLGEDLVRKILKKNNIYRDGEEIFVSCDYGVTKHGGKLFEVIMKRMGLDKSQLHHFGNSYSTEIKGARQIGISSTYLTEANLNRYETYLSMVSDNFRLKTEEAIKFSMMAGASRYSRLERVKEKKEIYEVASSVAAPILYKFVSNVLKNAEGKTVYFLARDGYIMYKIAEKIIQKKQYNTDIKYLYISRESLLLARIKDLEPDEYIEHIYAIYSMETLKQALKNMLVSAEVFDELKLDEEVMNTQVLNIDKEILRTVLTNKHVYNEVKSNSEKRRDRLLDYLKYEGMLEADNKIVVDVGWALTIQNYLSDLLLKHGASAPEGFYIGINESADSSLQSGRKYGYLWDRRKNIESVDIPRIIHVFEVFCSASHGQTVDYRVNGQSVDPVINNYESEHLVKWGAGDIESAILTFVDYMLEFNGRMDGGPFDQEILVELLKLFWMQPTKDEVELWGNYPYDISDNGEDIVRLFERRPFSSLMIRAIRTGKLPNTKKDHWPQANIYAQNPTRHTILKATLKLKKSLFFYKKNITSRLKSIVKKKLIRN